MKPYIITRSGQRFYFLNPEPTAIHIDDIAHALSLLCRFNGHCDTFYSVAEHSVEVCSLVESMGMERNIALTALLHDAAEAYIGDVVTPVKKLLPEFLKIEERLEQVIAEKFSLVYPFPKEIKIADKQALANEFATLKPYCTGKPRECLSPSDAKRLFLECFDRLKT